MWYFLLGAWIGRRIRQNREATAAAVGASVAAAVAAAVNPPRGLSHAEIDPLPEGERAQPQLSYDEHLERELRAMTRDQLLDFLERTTTFQRETALNLLSPVERTECIAQLKARHRTLRWAVRTALVSTITIVLMSFLLWDSFRITGDGVVFGAVAFIGVLIHLKTEKANLLVKIAVPVGLLACLAISLDHTAAYGTTLGWNADVGLWLALLGSILGTFAWGCESFHTAKAQANPSLQAMGIR